MPSAAVSRRRRAAASALLGLTAAMLAGAGLAQAPARALDKKLHHLGDTVVEAWAELVPSAPEGQNLRIEFESAANATDWVLSMRHQDVDDPWTVTLNGVAIGALVRGKELRTFHHIVPAGLVRDGKNQLAFTQQKKTDDIILGAITLHEGSLRQVLRLQPVRVAVRDGRGKTLPAKVTITDAAGRPVEIYYAARLHTAVRKGIAYTADGAVKFEVPPGDYKLYATRGSEWGLDSTDVRVPAAATGTSPVDAGTLTIDREVDTTGFVASDTHIHTLTHSGHGDSSVEERMVTLAGEGVELAIATDHNHHTDYKPTQHGMGLHEHFTSVTGNEVTTDVGHFNAFPLDPQGSLPNHKLKEWIVLVDDIRAKGAKVVILNHPRWPQIPTGPFGIYHLNRVSGDLPGRRAVPFDAMELVNTTTMLTDPMFLFTDWFALLNHGERVTAVGTSDSHTVGDPVGQGRTYVRSSTDDPGKIDVDEACRSFRSGDTTVSVGIFSDLTVDGRYHMGRTVPATDRKVSVSLRVASPSWVRPRLARVFVNGTKLVERAIPTTEGKPTDVRLPFQVPLPAHDGWLVCMVVGDGIGAAYWKTQKPYTMAATNPVYLDVDGDGEYTSPRALAKRLFDTHGAKPMQLKTALFFFDADDAVVVQVLSLARTAYERGAESVEQLQRARTRLRELVSGQPRQVVTDYLASLPSPQKVVEAAAARKKAQEEKTQKKK